MDIRLLAALAAPLALAIVTAAAPSQTTSQTSSPTKNSAATPSVKVAVKAPDNGAIVAAFVKTHCVACHDASTKQGGLDLTALPLDGASGDNFARWVRIHDRVASGEMPPKGAAAPPSAAQTASFTAAVASSLNASERAITARDGRAVQRRLNGYEYENALRDLLHAPWLQIRGQFPDDGEAFRFNKIGDALDVSQVHLARYLTAAEYALRETLVAHAHKTPTATRRFYARDQQTLTKTFTQNPFNSSPDRQTYPVLGSDAQPDVRARTAPLTVGDSDPKTRDLEAVGWVSSNYVTGFTYRWDQFKAPVAGRYRVRFCGYTLWAAPGGIARRFANGSDKVGTPGKPNPNTPDYDRISPGRTIEPITVYTRNGVMNRRVGAFDLTPDPQSRTLENVWLLAGETLVPDASRFYRSRPPGFKNPLMTKDGCPSVAFRWMEIEGPFNDADSDAGYRLMFGDLPASERDGRIEVVSANPDTDAERLLRGFLARAYRGAIVDDDVQRFLRLIRSRLAAGLTFTDAMIAGYTAVLASPRFVFLHERPGRLDSLALATRLSLFLWNALPDEHLRTVAARGELSRPDILHAETERLLNDPRSQRFTEAFLDYWLDLRKIEDSTPSTTLYNDYYLDDALTEAAVLESRLFFDAMIQHDLPARNVVDADFTFLNERLALHYGIPGVSGVEMRRVTLPPDSVRGGFLTQASVLKVTANGTTTSPVLRGKWILERILGQEVPPPPPVAAVEPDIRGAVTIRQQLDKHRSDLSCARCHRNLDPPGFALESFDVLGGWRERYRSADDTKPAERGVGKNGQAYTFQYSQPVDSHGVLPDGRAFTDIRELKRLLREDDFPIARNLARQMIVYATGAPIRFCDRAALDQIVRGARPQRYGARSLIHQIVQSDLFRNK